jgi:putative membrane protein
LAPLPPQAKTVTMTMTMSPAPQLSAGCSPGPKALPLVGADPATFSVKDWAALLNQGGPEAVLGKQVDLSGYVLDRGEKDVFFLARLAVSCCAVDAQPIGIPVYRPAWREQIEPGAWITIQGTFAKNPSPDSQESVAIGVGSLAKINEPDQPYVF